MSFKLVFILLVIVIFFCCKENANERNESLLSNCRVQLFFCKDTMIFAEVIYKKRTIICKKQTWFDFL